MLLADTARTRNWTMGRQSIGALAGRTDCGLAEDLLVRPQDGLELETFAKRLNRSGSFALVLPSLVPYFECAELPVLRDGVVDAPRYIVTIPNPFSPVRYPTSPFVGIFDLYRVEALPFSTTGPQPRDVLLYEVDQRIPGASRVFPDAATTRA